MITGNMGKSLSYRQGKFVFTNTDARPNQRIPDKAGPGIWEILGQGVWQTAELRAVVGFRRYADKTCQRLFERIFVKRYALPSVPLPDFLDPHQVEGVKWVLSKSRSYLAHAPGAGKTLQAITAALYSKGEGQVVFIVPPTLTLNWAKEIMSWASRVAPSLTFPQIAIVPESERQDRLAWRSDFLICPDTMLTKPWVLNALLKMKKRFIGIDEASRFKEPTSQRTIALFGGELKDGTFVSGGIIDKCPYVVLLDGSPMPNRAMELWAPTYAMFPEAIDFMDYQEFGFRYCGAKMNNWGTWEFKHSARLPELKMRLQREFMHVVKEEELNHPERLRSIVWMNEDVRSVEHSSWEESNEQLIKYVLTDEKRGEEMSQGDFAKFRKDLGLRKVPFIVKYTKEKLESGESVLLFAWHREVIERLAEGLKAYMEFAVPIMGGTPQGDREISFQNFQSGKAKLQILNLVSGGRGHNLPRAQRAIFGEWSWADETNKQCEKRGSRKGSILDVFKSDYIACPNSMDGIVLQANFTKAKNVKKVIG